MEPRATTERRTFLHLIGAAGIGLLLPNCSRAADERQGAPPPNVKDGEGAEDVSPSEDLMREHGLLNRVLLIYDESLRLLGGKQPTIRLKVVADAATIIRRFIEGYHEQLEENFLFPRFEKAGRLTDLVGVLRQQHQAGRALTDRVLHLTSTGTLNTPTQRGQLADALRQFVRMYRPHEAREDTVLFPAFHGLVTPQEYDTLGEQFEAKEHQLFGEDGFERMVDQVAGLEKTLGIYDLAKFTPRV